MLHKQHVGGGSSDLVEVVRDVVGLHATDPRTPYLSLLARLRGFAPSALDHELYETRAVVRVPAMRNTLFLVARNQVPMLIAATRASGLRSSWRYFAGRLSRAQYERTAPMVVAALRGRELTVREIKRALDPGCDVSAVVKLLCDEGVLVRARPAGSVWASQHAYALMSEWLPELDVAGGDEDAGLAWLVRAYVRGYGPVSAADVVWWTGASRKAVSAALGALATDLVSVVVDGSDDELLMLGDDLAALRAADGVEAAGLALLPQLDPYVQGCADRRRFLNPEDRPWVLDRKGNVTSTILLDGRVAGVWDVADRPVPEVRVHLFAPLAERHRRELHQLAEQAARLVRGEGVPIVEYRTMTPLTERAGWVRSPLEGASDRASLEPDAAE